MSLLPPPDQGNQKKSKKSQKQAKSAKDNESILNDDEDVLTKLKNELKIKEKVIKQLDNLCSLVSLSSNDSLSSLFNDSLSSRIQELLNENEQLKQKIEAIDSIIPNNDVNQNQLNDNEEDENDKDNLIPRCHLLVQDKEKQNSILNEIDSLLQKSASSSVLPKGKSKGKSKNKNSKKQDNEEPKDIVQKLKNELNDKSQLVELLDSFKSLINDDNDEGQLIDHFKTVFNSNNELNQLFDEICNLLNLNQDENNDDDDDDDNKTNIDRKPLIIPKIRELMNEKEELQKSIDEIQSLLPKSKAKESLASRIQKELKRKMIQLKN